MKHERKDEAWINSFALPQGVDDLIAEARRDLRKASGTPLIPQEQAEEDRRREIEALDKFVYGKFRSRLMDAFGVKVIWTERGTGCPV